MIDFITGFVVGIVVSSIIGGVGPVSALLTRVLPGRRRRTAGTFSDSGASVEVDCRACGQFNRVSSHRLRDRPKCGRCKARLMPGRRVVVCHVSPLEGPLRVELNALWDDEDRLWQSLADHVALQAKAKKEARNPNLRVVN
jgi:hypothetical protein